jgi:hypothetical protein
MKTAAALTANPVVPIYAGFNSFSNFAEPWVTEIRPRCWPPPRELAPRLEELEDLALEVRVEQRR